MGTVMTQRDLSGIVAIRDSKNPSRPALVVTPEQRTAFIDGVKCGEFDLPA
jgi:Domain of unknown function (DUF397)